MVNACPVGRGVTQLSDIPAHLSAADSMLHITLGAWCAVYTPKSKTGKLLNVVTSEYARESRTVYKYICSPSVIYIVYMIVHY